MYIKTGNEASLMIHFIDRPVLTGGLDDLIPFDNTSMLSNPQAPS